MEAKLAEAKRKKTMLIARKKTAEARIAAEDQLATGARKSKASSFAKFDRLEEKVDDLEAEAEALKELGEAEVAVAAEFEELEEGTDIEIELEELKRQTKKGKPEQKK